MEWLKNLSKAIEYIEKNLDGDLSYEEAAEIACCSPFYFQRLFSYVAGISLSEYVRRRRMTQAAFELQRTDAKVIDLALKYGYASPTAFNRAFQSVHKITPTAARRMGSTLNAYPAIHFAVQVTGGDAMAYHITEKGPMGMVGVRIPLCGDMEENQRRIPAFWQEVLKDGRFAQLCGLADQEPRRIFGVSVYEGPESFFYYIAAATDAPAPPGMYAFRIPEAVWAVFENNGYFKEDVQSVFRRFYTEWLPFSGYEYACLPDVEVYPVGPEIPVSGSSEVWIGIRKERGGNREERGGNREERSGDRKER